MGSASRGGAVWGYGLAILCAALAVAATEPRNPLFPTPLFFAAIVISTWYGGTIPGVVAVALATLALSYFFIPPARSLAFTKLQTPYIFEFAFPALLTCWFVRKRKIAESSLRVARDELQSRVEERQAELARVWRMMAVGEMGVSIAHEVNQPLMAVVLNGDACLRWLGTDPPNVEEARKAVSRIIHEGSRAGEIVARIRALAKKTQPNRVMVNLNELVAETVSMLDRAVVRRGVVLNTELASGLPSVRGDPVQLQQVILNLVMNALEAMSGDSPGPRTLRIRSQLQGLDSVEVAVEDSGPGLPADPDELFAAFFTTKPGGIGIGLSISRTIIEAHGGRLWAADSGHGALFQFRLPISAEGHDEPG